MRLARTGSHCDFCSLEPNNQRVAKDLCVSERLVPRYRADLVAFGPARPSSISSNGPKLLIRKAAERRLIEYREERTQSPSLDGLATLLAGEFNIEV